MPKCGYLINQSVKIRKMKHSLKYIFILTLTLMFSSCYKEESPLTGLVEIVGDVAQVSSVTAPTEGTAGSTIELTIRCDARNTNITEFKFYQRIGTSGAYTLTKSEAFVPNFSTVERLHVIKVPYTVPSEAGKTFSIQVEAITANGLVSARRTSSQASIKIL